MKWITTLLAAAVLGTVGGATAQMASAATGNLSDGEPCESRPNFDYYSTTQGGQLSVPPPGAMANDEVCGGVVELRTTSDHGGEVLVNRDGGFVYTPAPGFVGQEEFAYGYVGTDPGRRGLVRITVTPDGCAPAAVDDAYTIEQGANLDVDADDGVLDNDTHCGWGIRVLVDPSNGTLTIGDDGAFVCAPRAGFVGEDSFRYKLVAPASGFAHGFAGSAGKAPSPRMHPAALENPVEVTVTIRRRPAGNQPSTVAASCMGTGASRTPPTLDLSGSTASDTGRRAREPTGRR